MAVAAGGGDVRGILVGVPVSSRTRKVLWGRSGSRCAICRCQLVADRTPQEREVIVGQEARILAQSAGGPRFSPLAEHQVDDYDNLILLCPNHHRMVDEQPRRFPTEKLRLLKLEHERWVEVRLSQASSPSSAITLERDPDAPQELALLVRTGDELWSVLDRVQSYDFEPPSDREVPTALADMADEFLQLAHEWGEVSEDVTERGFQSVREAKRSLDKALSNLADHGLLVFGCRQRHMLSGGLGSPQPWGVATLRVVSSHDDHIQRLDEDQLRDATDSRDT